MANVDTVGSITDNLQGTLQGEGIRFSRKTFDDEKAIPASLIPFGQVFYRGEDFEYSHGQRPGYVEVSFEVRVVLKERDHASMVRRQQVWTHGVREALTVDAMNTGDLATTKLVSRVETSEVDIENRSSLSILSFKVQVRYREV